METATYHISDLPPRIASKLIEIQRRILIDGEWKDFLCWEFTGRWRSRYGYGRIKWEGRGQQLHRVVHEILTGKKIPPYMHGDHICRNPPCARWDHIEPVKPRDNVFRGQAILFRPLDQYESYFDVTSDRI